MSIYQHFREEERTFVDKVLNWKADVSLRYTRKLTDFLDPREQQIVTQLVGKSDEVGLSFWGGQLHSERKRAILFPPYDEIEETDYQIECFELDYPKKFVTIQHKDVLGSVLGLGLKREKFGDILFGEDSRIQFFVAAETADFVRANLTTVGRASISLNQISNLEQISNNETWIEQTGTVSSLRLDVMLSEIYRLSRTKVMPYIDRGYVKVNWKVIEQSSYQLQEGDHLSVRGLGRSKLLSIEGQTKKEKWRIHYGKLK
ncbi:RNA-binding protein [Bacillus alkalicellulosilyticus]|uniref:YlmH family RNA-binding protein n=1 Tax=Alkalihalobacterium alkalicellulosilyticum TaxID=1912214 RepID=UPI0009963863|nr:RNA-binding protein [Bacillus alkalicellulosilyticus]